MDIISAYREVGTYRGAAAISGTTPKTVKRVIARHESGGAAPARQPRGATTTRSPSWWPSGWRRSKGRITAKRLLPAARAAGYEGSARNFRRLVAARKALWRHDNHRGRRPAVWSPGEHLVIDWGVLGGLHVFCAVLAWCRVRFVRFADNERADTTLALLAECFETLGGVPGVVLADRMGCLKGGVVANKVVPTAEYVRFAAHHGFRPDFCEAADPESKGIVENLVGYAKTDLMIPGAGRVRRRAVHRPRGGEHRGRGVVCRGQRRGALARSARCRPSGWSSSGSCWPRCPRCGPASAGW